MGLYVVKGFLSLIKKLKKVVFYCPWYFSLGRILLDVVLNRGIILVVLFPSSTARLYYKKKF